ncbi:hypothetical protein BKK51_03195 [Rodentibacter trehalosifermentans]|uniref:HTH lysR-type domain-containing protein n=2 Tax=Rodentibacter trehalosifermentans TaxID=1908263 RepID=A0A1V3IV59_9PAST|nr:hypothetical protein BKK51_03195 [Rodentibacter trehalosifermentans]
MIANNINLQQLRLFLKVLETKNISEVARVEDLSASLVSRQLKQLEENLGTALFYRNTRAITPTDLGLQFAETATQMLRLFDNAMLKIHNQSEEISGTVRLNVPVLFGQKHIAKHLSELKQRYPKLNIQLTQTDRFVDPMSDSTDILVRINTLIDNTLKAKIIAKQQYFLVASPDYLTEKGTPKTWSDLTALDGLFYRGHTGMLRWLAKIEGKWQPISAQETLVSNNADTLIQATINKMGVLMMPDWAVADELLTGKLVRIFPDVEISSQTSPIHITILYPQTKKTAKNVRAAIDFLVEKWAMGW